MFSASQCCCSRVTVQKRKRGRIAAHKRTQGLPREQTSNLSTILPPARFELRIPRGSSCFQLQPGRTLSPNRWVAARSVACPGATTTLAPRSLLSITVNSFQLDDVACLTLFASDDPPNVGDMGDYFQWQMETAQSLQTVWCSRGTYRTVLSIDLDFQPAFVTEVGLNPMMAPVAGMCPWSRPPTCYCRLTVLRRPHGSAFTVLSVAGMFGCCYFRRLAIM